ncbi:MAG TPA: histidine phosphatase family protein [Solirubrobacteraceae bacterium]
MHASEHLRLYLVRHARTALNADGRLRGRLDPALDDVGRAEAAALATVIAALRPARIVSSPLRRAWETAAAIADPAGLPVLVAAGLIDRDYGPWAGDTEDAVIAQFGDLDLAPGVEPAYAVIKRARAVLDEQSEFLGAGPVVMVSHDAVNRLLLTDLASDLGGAGQLRQRTACWNVLSVVDGRWTVERVDEKVE